MFSNWFENNILSGFEKLTNLWLECNLMSHEAICQLKKQLLKVYLIPKIN